MKKGFKAYVAAWAVMVIVFNVIAFATPSEIGGESKFGGAFWSGYVFIMLAFTGQILCTHYAFQTENKNRLFLNLSLVTISYTALLLSFVVGGVCMFVPSVPNWVGIILCAILLGFTAISVIKAGAAAEMVPAVEERIKEKTAVMRSLTMDAEGLLVMAKDAETKATCQRVYEAFRYSDPVSSDSLMQIESEISVKFDSFAELVKAGENCADIATELTGLILLRNRKCRAMK